MLPAASEEHSEEERDLWRACWDSWSDAGRVEQQRCRQREREEGVVVATLCRWVAISRALSRGRVRVVSEEMPT